MNNKSKHWHKNLGQRRLKTRHSDSSHRVKRRKKEDEASCTSVVLMKIDFVIKYVYDYKKLVKSWQFKMYFILLMGFFEHALKCGRIVKFVKTTTVNQAVAEKTVALLVSLQGNRKKSWWLLSHFGCLARFLFKSVKSSSLLSSPRVSAQGPRPGSLLGVLGWSLCPESSPESSPRSR